MRNVSFISGFLWFHRYHHHFCVQIEKKSYNFCPVCSKHLSIFFPIFRNWFIPFGLLTIVIKMSFTLPKHRQLIKNRLWLCTKHTLVYIPPTTILAKASRFNLKIAVEIHLIELKQLRINLHSFFFVTVVVYAPVWPKPYQ